MSTFIHSAFRGMLKGLLRLLGGFLLLVALVVFVVWSQNRQTSEEKWKADAAAARTPPLPAAPSQWATPLLSQSELQTLIMDIYHLEDSEFVRSDLLRVSFGPDEHDPQGKCQGIANVWSFRTGLKNVFVECWSGNQRIGFGTVVNGELKKP